MNERTKGTKITDMQMTNGSEYYDDEFKYRIPRGIGFEKEIAKLFNTYDNSNSGLTYGTPFENDVFSVFPYYYGECTCGFDEHEFTEEHKKECFQSRLKNIMLLSGWAYNTDYGYPFLQYTRGGIYKESAAFHMIVKSLCNDMGLPYKDDAGTYCTCDYEHRYKQWLIDIGYPNGHKDDCLLLKPNFLYKPTGLAIMWYKYAFRSAFANQPIDIDKFREIIKHCIESV